MERVVEAALRMPAREGAHDDAAAVPWHEVVRMVRGQMRSLVGTAPELEDLTQSALERLMRGWSSFEGRAALSTFTYRICVRVALNHWRGWRRWLRRFVPGLDGAPEHAAPDSESLRDEAERARRVHALLEKLPASKRAVLVLADLEDMPASRIAEILGCPEPTVRSRLRSARLAFAELVRRDPLLRGEE